jgi:hypothetical protein
VPGGEQSLPVQPSKRYGACDSSRLIACRDWAGRVAWRYELGAAHCCLTGVPMADAYVVIESQGALPQTGGMIPRASKGADADPTVGARLDDDHFRFVTIFEL